MWSFTSWEQRPWSCKTLENILTCSSWDLVQRPLTSVTAFPVSLEHSYWLQHIPKPKPMVKHFDWFGAKFWLPSAFLLFVCFSENYIAWVIQHYIRHRTGKNAVRTGNVLPEGWNQWLWLSFSETYMWISETCSPKPFKSSPWWFGLILNPFTPELNYQNQDLWLCIIQLSAFFFSSYLSFTQLREYICMYITYLYVYMYKYIKIWV